MEKNIAEACGSVADYHCQIDLALKENGKQDHKRHHTAKSHGNDADNIEMYDPLCEHDQDSDNHKNHREHLESFVEFEFLFHSLPPGIFSISAAA